MSLAFSRTRVLLLIVSIAACGQEERSDGDASATEPRATSPTPFVSKNPRDNAPLVVPPLFDCRAVPNDDRTGTTQYPVPKPPFSKDMFPCTRCHDKLDDYNPTPRPLLAMHTNIRLVHGSREQWCYDCHNPSYRDKLRLASGRLVSFETSYELCGQCHGEKLRDWRNGIHGRRIGCWNGQRQYLLCVNCHDPHAPRFKPMHPRPRPKRPDEIHFDSRSET
jgi:Doubled CXXCH motif (Paired_CXXCH_1)